MHTHSRQLGIIGLASLCAGIFTAPVLADTLYFKNNFGLGNGIGTRVNSGTWAQDLFGQDNALSGKDHWQTDMERNSGASSINGSSIGAFYINRMNASAGAASLVSDPVDPSNHVLKFAVNAVSETFSDPELSRGRVQAEFNGNVNWKEFSLLGGCLSAFHHV